jgi:hypothetical protein
MADLSSHAFVSHSAINKNSKNFLLTIVFLPPTHQKMSAEFTTPVNLHGVPGSQNDSKQASYSVKAGLAQMLKVSCTLPRPIAIFNDD